MTPVLTRTTPLYAINLTWRRDTVSGICEACGWETPAVPTAGMVASIMAEHGRVLSDWSAFPACPAVQWGIEVAA